MASYRPFHPPPQSTFPPPPPPNQNPLQPPPAAQPPPPPRGRQYSQTWGPYNSAGGSNYSQNYTLTNQSSTYQLSGYGSSSQQPQFNPQPRNQPPPYQYQPPPPPPPESSSYPPPPPPQSLSAPPMYFPSSQYSQLNQPRQSLETPPPPPPPASPPPSPPPAQPSSPPPLPSALPPTGISRESKNAEISHKQESKPPLPSSGKKPIGLGPVGKIETEEERRLRKRREYEKQKHDEKMKQHLKDSQNKVLQKTQMLASGFKGHGSISGSHMGDSRTTSLLSGDRIENRLKKPTTFICKMKFRNELPDPSAKMKLLPLPKDPDRYCKYKITSLEKNWKPQLYVEPDLGIPLDLLDLSVYNPPKGEKIPLDPEDEELLRDDEPITPIKKDGIKTKERPTDKGVSWLVKTQYISPISMDSTKQSHSEKQAKQFRESRDRDLLENLNNREMQIENIENSFESCKSKPVNKENPELRVKRVLPLFPFFDRYDEKFVVANFDSAPTADSEVYSKLSVEDRDEHERKAIMKSYVASSSEAEQPDKFLAYMVPSIDELEKDIYDENEDVSYSWIREYHWDARGDDVDDPNTYLVAFGDTDAKYVPLPTKLMLRKKRARDGKSSQETEHFPVPRSVTVRKRPTVAALELRDEESEYVGMKGSAAKRRDRMNGSSSRLHRIEDRDRDDGDDQFSGAEEDEEMSD